MHIPFFKPDLRFLLGHTQSYFRGLPTFTNPNGLMSARLATETQIFEICVHHKEYENGEFITIHNHHCIWRLFIQTLSQSQTENGCKASDHLFKSIRGDTVE